MTTLVERVCRLMYSIVVMQRLMLGMAQEIDTLSEALGHAGGDPVYTTEQTRTSQLDCIQKQEMGGPQACIHRRVHHNGRDGSELAGTGDGDRCGLAWVR
jgi:hypothetical protein